MKNCETCSVSAACKKCILAQTKTKNNASVTHMLFYTTQIAALGWVSLSYLIALYSSVKLGQVYPVESLSSQAIITIFGSIALKVVSNIFEHNDGVVQGTSTTATINKPDDNSGR